MMAMSKMNVHPKDYATFSIQDVNRAEDNAISEEDHQRQLMQRVFSSSTTSHDDGDTAHLSERGQNAPGIGHQYHQHSQHNHF